MSKGCLRLLLLPPPPSDLGEEAFGTAYKPAVTEALLNASSQSGSSLDIAVVCSTSAERVSSSRNQLFPFYQSVLAGIYRLCCHVCAEKGIDPVKPGYVDFRVLLIEPEEAPGLTTSVKSPQGPLFSLKSLALAERKWEIIQSMEGEATHGILRKFLELRRSDAAEPSLRSFTVSTVPGGISVRAADAKTSSISKEPRQNNVVAVGGTFDNLHEGHKLLLSCTALAVEPPSSTSSALRRVIIGVTGDQLLVNKKYAEVLESWDQRQEASFRFVHSVMSLAGLDSDVRSVERRNEPGPNGKAVIYHLAGLDVECVEINDPFGPTITDETCSALVVSAETRSGGKAVNDKRTEKGWKELEVFEVDVLGPSGSSDLQDKISSTMKRKRRLEAQNRKL